MTAEQYNANIHIRLLENGIRNAAFEAKRTSNPGLRLYYRAMQDAYTEALISAEQTLRGRELTAQRLMSLVDIGRRV